MAESLTHKGLADFDVLSARTARVSILPTFDRHCQCEVVRVQHSPDDPDA